MEARRRPTVLLILALVGALSASSLAQVQEPVDLDAIYRIKNEGLERSELMETVSYLTDVHGPRLTNSPGLKAAADYVLRRLAGWGVKPATLEVWGTFGPGWSNERMVALAVSPQAYPLIAYPKAWTPGTDGPVRGEAMLVRITNDKDFETFRGKLRGKFALIAQPRQVQPSSNPLSTRYSDEQLNNIARQPAPARGGGPQGQPGGGQNFTRRLRQFFVDEGVVASLEPGPGDGGTVFVGDGRIGRDPKSPALVQLVVTVEQYNRIARTLDKKIPVVLEIDIRSSFHTSETSASNIIAELPGTDKAAEVVMLGAHFDSWHTGTGATDNAAGSAIMLEVMRILKATGLKMRRTVRLALWTGEEQGLLGSREYVAQHFGDRRSMQLRPEHANISAYFNVDNGTGAIRGVYLQGNEAVAPVFERWMEPFRNLSMTTLSIRNTGGTDHLSFDEVGLPGFQFIQDPIEYSSRTHHSNMDVYDRLQSADLMQNAVIVASFVYHAANREEKLPRKPLPKPRPDPPNAQAQPGQTSPF